MYRVISHRGWRLAPPTPTSYGVTNSVAVSGFCLGDSSDRHHSIEKLATGKAILPQNPCLARLASWPVAIAGTTAGAARYMSGTGYD